MKSLVYVAMALAAGLCIPVQAGINATLARYVDGAVGASLVSFLVGTLALAAFMLAARLPLPIGQALASAPAWAWVGGTLGAYLVATTVLVAPTLGAGTMIALIVAGQMACSLVLDHYGWLGFDPQPISWPRLLGAALLVAGVVLIRKY